MCASSALRERIGWEAATEEPRGRTGVSVRPAGAAEDVAVAEVDAAAVAAAVAAAASFASHPCTGCVDVCCVSR